MGNVQVINPPDRISQNSLEVVIALSNVVRRFQRQLRTAEAELFNRLDAGAEIEYGTHTAEIAECVEGGTRVQRLEVR